MKKKLKTLLALCSIGLLSACTTTKVHLAINEVINFGDAEFPAKVLNKHVIGIAGFDEEYAARAARVARNNMFTQGIQPDTPEYQYRATAVNTGEAKGMLYVADGQFRYQNAAMIPDHIERIRAGDIVEYRQVSGRLANKDFAKTGEGNIILQVLCRKADTDYEKCWRALPQTGKFGPGGFTSRPYPVSAKEYGFTFTPAYDEKGNPLRAIPEYKPKS